MLIRDFILLNVFRTVRSLAGSGQGSHRRDSGGSKLNERHERAMDGWCSWSRIGPNWLGRPLTKAERRDIAITLEQLERRGLLIRERAEGVGRTTWVKLTAKGNRIAAKLVAVQDDIDRKADAVSKAQSALQHFRDDLKRDEDKIANLEKQLAALEVERPSMYPSDYERQHHAINYFLEHAHFLADCSRSMAGKWEQTLAEAVAAAGGG